MALIVKEQFEHTEKKKNSVHKPTKTLYTAFVVNGEKFFQIDTLGSDERKMTEKVSQSMQLDKSMAETLIRVLKVEFRL